MITVYLLNYNYKEYVRNAIESLESQNNQNFNVLLIDNGSTDGSDVILKSSAKKNGWEFVSLPNLPLGAVGNYVLKRSCSEYIVRLDADDILEDHYIEYSIKEIRKNSPALIFFNYSYIDFKGDFLGTHSCIERTSAQGPHDEAVHGACTLIKRTEFLNHGGYSENFKCQDGFDLYLKLRHSHISLIKEVGFRYRKGHNSLSSNKKRLFDTRIKMINELAESECVERPKTTYVFVCDSSQKNVNGFVESASNFVAKFSNEKKIIVSSKEISPFEWDLTSDTELIYWKAEESRLPSSRALISRIIKAIKSEYLCVVNMSESIAPYEYIITASVLSKLFSSDGVITGVRFEQSLFKPVTGGVIQANRDGKNNDLDRWVVHLGGITCLKTETYTKALPVFTLMELVEDDCNKVGSDIL